MGWFKGGEGAPDQRSGGNFGGPELLGLILLGGFILLMILCIAGFGFAGIGIGLGISTIIFVLLGLIYGDW